VFEKLKSQEISEEEKKELKKQYSSISSQITGIKSALALKKSQINPQTPFTPGSPFQPMVPGPNGSMNRKLVVEDSHQGEGFATDDHNSQLEQKPALRPAMPQATAAVLRGPSAGWGRGRGMVNPSYPSSGFAPNFAPRPIPAPISAAAAGGAGFKLDNRPCRVLVKNIPQEFNTQEALMEHFGPYGNVASITVTDDQAVIQFSSRPSAENAMKKGFSYHGAILSLSWAPILSASSKNASTRPAEQENQGNGNQKNQHQEGGGGGGEEEFENEYVSRTHHQFEDEDEDEEDEERSWKRKKNN